MHSLVSIFLDRIECTQYIIHVLSLYFFIQIHKQYG